MTGHPTPENRTQLVEIMILRAHVGTEAANEAIDAIPHGDLPAVLAHASETIWHLGTRKTDIDYPEYIRSIALLAAMAAELRRPPTTEGSQQ